MKYLVLFLTSFCMIVTALSYRKTLDYKEEAKVYKNQLQLTVKQNETYERYYCATEEMLDKLPLQLSDSLTTTKQGFRYIEEKSLVDSICHNIRP